MAVTERDRLAAAARAAGLRLGSGDLDRLLPAYQRYVALVEDLSAQLTPEPLEGDD